MRLHTDLHTWRTVQDALTQAQAEGKVADHVYLWKCDEYGSRTKQRAFEIRLGTDTKIKGDGRGWTNTGKHGANSEANGEGIYAATYDEWGWFIANLFELDPNATFGTYVKVHGFNTATSNKYVKEGTP